MSLKPVGHRVATLAEVMMTKPLLQRLTAVAVLTLAVFGAAEQAMAGNIFTGQFGTGNTWNLYEGIGTNLTFREALDIAATRPDPTGGTAVGHLVTLLTQEENDFVQTNATGNRWIGLTDRVGVAPGAMESAFMADPLTEGWAWVTGEPFSFQAWGAGEPNNVNGEDAVHLRGDLFWNDHQSAFGADEPVPDPESTAEGLQAFPFVIEWSTNLATMPTGFPMTRPDPPQPPLGSVYPQPLARLPGPTGTATAWGTREVFDNGGSGSTIDAINFVVAGTGTNIDGTVDRFDVTDIATNPNPVGVIGDPPVEFIGGGGDNFQVVTKGTVRVPAGQGGDYTFSVRSDDGFGLRILSQAASGAPLVQHKFKNASVGRVDADGSLVFLAPTGDSNTLGVINLPEGTYDVEFIMYENGGGAFYEVSTAKGDFVANPGIARWIVLGDGSSLPGAGPFKQAARLTGPVDVRAYNDTVAGGATLIADIVANVRTNPAPTAQGPADDVVLNGDGNLGIHGATLPTGFVHQFPNGIGIDMFSTAVTGEFTVLDTNGAAGETLTFGLFADDNAALHILGEDFTAAAGGGGAAVLGNPEGLTDQWLVADFRTGNTDSYGLITLPEGTYDFEAFQLEEGGGAALEVWVAAGDQTATGFNSGAFFPLTIDTMPDAFLGGNQGLGLVAGPGTGPVTPAGVDGDFNGDGTVNAADYVAWRNGGPLQNDPTPGVQPGDYDVWRANFGRTAGAGAAGAAGVPEPTTLVISAIAAMLVGFVSARSRRG
jgi:hypothetical protein